MDRTQLLLEIAGVLTGAATPIVVAVLGVLLLRRIEGVKALVARQSEFRERWAGEFVESCHSFMKALERDLALLTTIGTLDDPNGEFGTTMQKELSHLNTSLSELELRIRRSVVFAPLEGPGVTSAANNCLRLIGTLIQELEGDIDVIIAAMNDFNLAARKAHAEMIGVSPGE